MVFSLLAAGAIGGLLGGGDSQTTVTTTQSISNSFNPVSNINLGGGIAPVSPSGPISGAPVTSTSSPVQSNPRTVSLPLPGVGGGLPPISFGGGGSPLPNPNFVSTPGVSGGGSNIFDTLLGNPLLLAAIGGGAYLLMKG